MALWRAGLAEADPRAAAHSLRDVFWLRLLMVRTYETPTRWVML